MEIYNTDYRKKREVYVFTDYAFEFIFMKSVSRKDKGRGRITDNRMFIYFSRLSVDRVLSRRIV